jgi:hypothetical protein
VSETERRPAEAYFDVVEILGDSFFMTPPPSVGYRVSIQGIDGAYTTWELTDAQMIWLRPLIFHHSRLRWVSAEAYDCSTRVK